MVQAYWKQATVRYCFPHDLHQYPSTSLKQTSHSRGTHQPSVGSLPAIILHLMLHLLELMAPQYLPETNTKILIQEVNI